MLGLKIVRVKGDSMEPTFKNNDILVIKTRFSKSSLRKKDIILFKSPLIENQVLIKRIIALPSEFVQIYNNDTIKISKTPDSAPDPLLEKNWIQFEWDLQENEFIVLGDNTFNSQDSKTFGPISFDSITGKVILKLKGLRF